MKIKNNEIQIDFGLVRGRIGLTKRFPNQR